MWRTGERESPTKESIVKVFYGLFSLVRVSNKLFDKEIIKSILNLFCVFLNIVTFNNTIQLNKNYNNNNVDNKYIHMLNHHMNMSGDLEVLVCFYEYEFLCSCTLGCSENKTKHLFRYWCTPVTLSQ